MSHILVTVLEYFVLCFINTKMFRITIEELCVNQQDVGTQMGGGSEGPQPLASSDRKAPLPSWAPPPSGHTEIFAIKL